MIKYKYQPGGVEAGEALPAPNDNKVRLTGHAPLMALGDLCIKRSWEDKASETEEILLSRRIGVGYRFFYIIQEVDAEGWLGAWEKGVGYLEKEGEDTFLVRELGMSFGDTIDEDYPYTEHRKPIKWKRHSHILRITSIPPDSYKEALSAPHSVLASIDPGIPSPVHLEENTLLGRKDDIIQSIDKEEFKEILNFKDEVVDSVTKSTKQLELKARRVELKRKDSAVSAPVLRVAPDNYSDDKKPPAQQGSIIYNMDTKSLQFYDGTEWRTLVWE